MEEKITASVGEGGVNKSTDVAAVDRLLKAVGMLEEEGFFDRLFKRVGGTGDVEASDARRIAAIKSVQEIWGLGDKKGKCDGKIDPGGRTLARLNQTATPLKLEKIEHAKDKGKLIKNGGYKICFTPDAPPAPYQLWLGVNTSVGKYVDVSGCRRTDVMKAKTLPGLLTVIKNCHQWGKRLDVKLFVVLNGHVITTSNSEPLYCPVFPHNGKLMPLDQANNGEVLTYQQNEVTKAYEGRFLEQVKDYDGSYFFGFDYYGGSYFETNDSKRGFDCITYVGAVCGAPPWKMGRPEPLIEWLETKMSASVCTCEKHIPPTKGKPATKTTITLNEASLDDIKEYFKVNTTGYYAMWSANHVVMVADGFVYEFAGGAFRDKGYNRTAIDTWLSDKGRTSTQSVRKLGKTPPLCG